jgi:hypothetical protein
MGVLIKRAEDPELYREAYEEAQRIIRISDEIRISLEKVAKEEDLADKQDSEEPTDKLTTSKLAQKHGMKTGFFLEKLVNLGYLEARMGKNYITAKGKELGGEFKMSKKYGPYFVWPENLPL